MNVLRYVSMNLYLFENMRNTQNKNQEIKYYLRIKPIYNCSTSALAHGVFLKNVRLDLMDGSNLKQRILILLPNSSQP